MAMALRQEPPAELGDALLAWINSLDVVRPADATGDVSQGTRARLNDSPTTLHDLSDGLTLGYVLLSIDSVYFESLGSASVKALSGSWVLRFNHLKRLYKLVMQYFENVLRCSTTNLATPNLQLIAQSDKTPDYDLEILKLIGLALALAVQSDKRLEFVNGIQGLDEWVQRDIMWSIENVMSRIGQVPDSVASSMEQATAADDMDGDSQFYALHQDRSQLLTDKDALQFAYDSLMQSFNALKDEHEAALSSLAKADKQAQEAKSARSDKPDVVHKAELERVKATLSKTEEQLTEVEQTAADQQKLVEELSRKVEELTPRAEEATRLKDQLDEHKHASERLKKTEHVVEKYKKKLEEAGDLRRQIKSLETENAELVDKYALLEEEHSKLAAETPQITVFQSQIDKLQAKLSTATRESEQLRHDLGLALSREEELKKQCERDTETIASLEERTRELESNDVTNGGSHHDVDDRSLSLDGESSSNLKLKVRRLQRELDKLREGGDTKAGESTLQVELAEVERLRHKYEVEWLAEHRKRLALETQLDEIASGKSKHGDGPQACAALRRRLETASKELDDLRSRRAELESRVERLTNELDVAHSDLELVDQDQLEALRALRQSVSVDKAAIEDKLAQARLDLQNAQDELKLQTSQVNALLREQIALQQDGIEQRDRLLEREANATQVAELKQKLKKAKEFIKQQDEQFRERYEAAENGMSEEAVQEFESRIATLTDELARQRTNTAELEARYRREQQLMLSAWHDLGMRHMREGVANEASSSRATAAQRNQLQPTSWLAQQRARTVDKSLIFVTNALSFNSTRFHSTASGNCLKEPVSIPVSGNECTK
ncbi:hypothetical protein ACM66B_006288 [Microbotryomycetes sp. NB124-2]